MTAPATHKRIPRPQADLESFEDLGLADVAMARGLSLADLVVAPGGGAPYYIGPLKVRVHQVWGEEGGFDCVRSSIFLFA